MSTGIQPRRVQLSRAKGWRMPENTLKVDRTTMFGNIYAPAFDEYLRKWAVGWMYGFANAERFESKLEATAAAVSLFRAEIIRPGAHHTRLNVPVPYQDDCIKYLRGRNVACWCKLTEPCHADVLLELANAPQHADPQP